MWRDDDSGRLMGREVDLLPGNVIRGHQGV